MYSQGAINIFQIPMYENCDDSNYLNLRFYAPDDLVSVNKVMLTFKLKGYRAYSTGATSAADKSTQTISISLDWDLELSSTGLIGQTILDVQSGGTFSTHEWISTFLDRSTAAGTTTRYFRYATGSSTDVAAGNGTLVYNIGSYALGMHDGITTNYQDSTDRNGSIGWLQVSDSANFDAGGVGYNDEQLITIRTLATHTHDINFGIIEQSLTSPSVDIYVGIDGSESLLGTYTVDKTDLNITHDLNITGGNWYNIQFRPNKNMRIESNLYLKCYIQSK